MRARNDLMVIEYMSLTQEGGSRRILRIDKAEVWNSGRMAPPAESRARLIKSQKGEPP